VKDGAIVILLSASLALAVTAHLSIVYGLLHRPPRWRGVLAFFVPLASPYFANRSGMHTRAVAMVTGAIGYAVLRYLAGT
jgi:hypothetical protein